MSFTVANYVIAFSAQCSVVLSALSVAKKRTAPRKAGRS